MKTTRLFFLLLSFTLFLGCSEHHNLFTGRTPKPAPEQAASNTAAPASQQPSTPQEQGPADSLVLSYERTACFGQCPIYKISVYESGYAVYEGINFVERIGKYDFRLDPQLLQDLLTEGDKRGFFRFENVYRSGVSDLPSRIVFMRYKGKAKMVLDESAGPPELLEIEKILERNLTDLDWKPVLK